MSADVRPPNNLSESTVDLSDPVTMSSLGTSLSALATHIPADRRAEANSPWSFQGERERESENKHTLISSTVLKIPFCSGTGRYLHSFCSGLGEQCHQQPRRISGESNVSFSASITSDSPLKELLIGNYIGTGHRLLIQYFQVPIGIT